jgi:hypothetical protein
LIVGSTIFTQLQKNEAEVKKGFVELEVGGKLKIDFVPLEKCRKFFYEEINLSGQSVRMQVEQRIDEILSTEAFSKPPVIRLKLVGKDSEVVDRDLAEIEKKFSGKAILIFAKELESQEITEKMEFFKNLREQKLSVEEIGLNLLKKILEDLNFSPTFDYEKIFWLLSGGETEKVFKLLTGEQTTLDMLKR